MANRLDSFLQGTGQQPESCTCSDCGYASTKRKHFKKGAEEGQMTCSTGHYEDGSGNLKRARNPYAKRS